MYRFIAVISFVFVFAWLLGSDGHASVSDAAAVSAPTTTLVVELVPVAIHPPVSARAYAIVDLDTGELLATENAETAYPIASITKLFTAAHVLQSDPQPLRLTAADVATYGNAGKLSIGDEYTSYELLYPLLLESSNDAAAALERVYGLPKFPAIQLADGSGLSADNQASAHVLATALRQLHSELPHLFDITQLSQFIGAKTGWVNNSPVQAELGYQGGKHGYTEVAQHTLAAVFAEPALQDRKLGYVVLGSADVERDVTLLREALVTALTKRNLVY